MPDLTVWFDPPRVVGLALVTAHPGQVRTLVAHEPPVVELLPDSIQVRAQIEDI